MPRGDGPTPPRAKVTSDPTKIPTGSDSDAVWGPLLHTWLAWRTAATTDLHVKAARRWTPGAYQPVLVPNSEGRPVLAFEK